MSMTITFPDDLYREAERMALAQNLSVDEVVASIFVNHVRGWWGNQQRSARTERDKFVAVSDKEPNT